jgi:hypothetical protein
VLELRNAEREVLDLLALCQPRTGQGSFDGLVPPGAEPLRLAPPRLERVPDGASHRVAVDADPARKVVRELVGRLDTERCEAEAGKQELGEGARRVGALGAHAPILGTASGGVSARGRAVCECSGAAGAVHASPHPRG